MQLPPVGVVPTARAEQMCTTLIAASWQLGFPGTTQSLASALTQNSPAAQLREVRHSAAQVMRLETHTPLAQSLPIVQLAPLGPAPAGPSQVPKRAVGVMRRKRQRPPRQSESSKQTSRRASAQSA